MAAADDFQGISTNLVVCEAWQRDALDALVPGTRPFHNLRLKRVDPKRRLWRSDLSKLYLAAVSDKVTTSQDVAGIDLPPTEANGLENSNIVPDPRVEVLVVPSSGILRFKSGGARTVSRLLKPKRYMTLGDSLTAGFQHGVLRGNEQKVGHGRQAAGQMGIPFDIAEVQGDGGLAAEVIFGLNAVGSDVQNMRWMLDLFTGDPTTDPGFRENVGVTGYTTLNLLTNEFIGDFERTQLEATLPADPDLPTGFLQSKRRSTQPQAVLRMRPSLVTCWIGANDALGTMTSGIIQEDGYYFNNAFESMALDPGNLANPARFAAEYAILAEQMRAIHDAFGTDVIFGPAPRVSDAPTSIPWSKRRNDLPRTNVSDRNRVGKTPFGHRIDRVFNNRNTDVSRPVAEAALVPQALPLPHPDFGLPAGLAVAIDPAKVRRVPYLYLLSEEVLLPNGPLFPFRFSSIRDTMEVDQRAFLTETELNYADARVESFASSLIDAINAQGFPAPINVNEIFNDLFSQRYDTQSHDRLWGQIGDSRDGDEAIQVKKCLGAVFGADQIHPSSTGYAIVADKVIRTINDQIRLRKTFGGFTRPIPAIYFAGGGHDRLSAIAQSDPFFKRIIEKRNTEDDF
jgi:lysophospholipase L1-like esterase